MLKSQREALDKIDATIWDGFKYAKDESDSLRAWSRSSRK